MLFQQLSHQIIIILTIHSYIPFKMKSNRHQINRHKLLQEQKQTQTILIDYQKAKQKCIRIHKQLQLDFVTLPQFEAIQRETELKMKILDLYGLVGLKNQLVKTLGELYELEEELDTKKKRRQLAKELNSSREELLVAKNLVKDQMNSQFKRIRSYQRGEINDILEFMEDSQQENLEPEKNSKNSFEKKIGATRNSKNRMGVQIPVYRPKDDTVENKIDKISKYLAALKRNMKYNAVENSKFKQSSQDLLEMDPEFNNMITELKNYQKKEVQFQSFIEEQADRAFRKLITQFEPVEEGQESVVIKININTPPKNQIESYLYDTLDEITTDKNGLDSSKSQVRRQLSEKANYYPMYNTLEIKRNISEVQNEEEMDDDIMDLKEEFSKENVAIESVVNKISETLETSEKKLIELRERRKKLFMDEDLWGDEP